MTNSNSAPFPYPISRIQDAHGAHVFSFSHQGMAISNPFESECGRFLVSPAQYGLSEEQGCWLIELNSAIELAAQAAVKEGVRTIESVLGRFRSDLSLSHFAGENGRERTAGIALAMAEYLEAELRQKGFVFENDPEPAVALKARSP